jgi:peroxiredoxin
MTEPSSYSRLFLVGLITVVLAAIVVVACSRDADVVDDTAYLRPKAAAPEQAGPQAVASVDSPGLPPDADESDGDRSNGAEDAADREAKDTGMAAQDTGGPPLVVPGNTAADAAPAATPDVTPPGNGASAQPAGQPADMAPPPANDAAAATQLPKSETPAKMAAPVDSATKRSQPDLRAGKATAPASEAKQTIQPKTKPATGGDSRPLAKTDRPKVDPVGDLARRFQKRKTAGWQRQEPATVTAPPVEVREPLVALSSEHVETCLVRVGDTMPALVLPDGEGQQTPLADSLGKRLTVVMFWSAANPYAADQFRQMKSETVPFADQGVQTVAIHVGVLAPDVAELASAHGADVVCLFDEDGQAFRKVATRKLPRTYLLDAQGKVLWFDIEYSQPSREALQNAVRYHLRQTDTAAAAR